MKESSEGLATASALSKIDECSVLPLLWRQKVLQRTLFYFSILIEKTMIARYYDVIRIG